MFQLINHGSITGYTVYYNERMIAVNSSISFSTEEFSVSSAQDFSLNLNVTVAARNRYGEGPRSEPKTTLITGMYA